MSISISIVTLFYPSVSLSLKAVPYQSVPFHILVYIVI